MNSCDLLISKLLSTINCHSDESSLLDDELGMGSLEEPSYISAKSDKSAESDSKWSGLNKRKTFEKIHRPKKKFTRSHAIRIHGRENLENEVGFCLFLSSLSFTSIN